MMSQTDISQIVTDNYEIENKILEFINEFELTDTPIEVSFRALLPQLKNIDRFSHLIHTYPAKLLLHIPYFFLNNNIFSQPGDLILDPFCGTGTVLLEAIIAGRNAIGADANPLARLIATVKTSNYITENLQSHLKEILLTSDDTVESGIFPDVVNLDYWFNDRIKISLNNLLTTINLIVDQHIKNFFLVCFSNLVKKVSFADPRVSVPVKLNKNRYAATSLNYKKVEKRLADLDAVDVKEKFKSICQENINRIQLQESFYKSKTKQCAAGVISDDARSLTTTLNSNEKIPDGAVSLIITSPPYAGAQKYIRSSSLNLGWLGLAKVHELKDLDSLNIGRENYKKTIREVKKTNISDCDDLIQSIIPINLLRAQIVSNYILEMQKALNESIRVLKHGGYLVLIVGNNKVCNKEFNTQEYLTEYIQNKGLKLIFKLIDDIKSYGLMTKRNKTADIISREWVLVFRKL
jgi:DNA modification methylase